MFISILILPFMVLSFFVCHSGIKVVKCHFAFPFVGCCFQCLYYNKFSRDVNPYSGIFLELLPRVSPCILNAKPENRDKNQRHGDCDNERFHFGFLRVVVCMLLLYILAENCQPCLAIQFNNCLEN